MAMAHLPPMQQSTFVLSTHPTDEALPSSKARSTMAPSSRSSLRRLRIFLAVVIPLCLLDLLRLFPATSTRGTSIDSWPYTLPLPPRNETTNVATVTKLPPAPYPAIVVGFPKSGTTSVWNFFHCSGLRAQHYCAGGDTSHHPPCRHGLMAVCILQNLGHGRPMLEGCGDYQVYAQLDGERPVRRLRPGVLGSLTEAGEWDPDARNTHFLPQHFWLDQLHDDYPSATFILPLRPPHEWAASAMNWFHMRHYVAREYWYHNRSLERPQGLPAFGEFLERIYVEHTSMVEDFCRRHPSHRLVVVNIKDEHAGQVLAEAFGLEADCWGHFNQAIHHDKLGNRTAQDRQGERLETLQVDELV